MADRTAVALDRAAQAAATRPIRVAALPSTTSTATALERVTTVLPLNPTPEARGIHFAVNSCRPMPRHEDRGARQDEQAVQRSRVRARTQRDVQHRRAEQRLVPPRPHHVRRRLQHAIDGRHVHQHDRPPAPQHRHDEGRQDLQDQVHVRHVAEERLVRNDAHQVAPSNLALYRSIAQL